MDHQTLEQALSAAKETLENCGVEYSENDMLNSVYSDYTALQDYYNRGLSPGMTVSRLDMFLTNLSAFVWRGVFYKVARENEDLTKPFGGKRDNIASNSADKASMVFDKQFSKMLKEQLKLAQTENRK